MKRISKFKIQFYTSKSNCPIFQRTFRCWSKNQEVKSVSKKCVIGTQNLVASPPDSWCYRPIEIPLRWGQLDFKVPGVTHHEAWNFQQKLLHQKLCSSGCQRRNRRVAARLDCAPFAARLWVSVSFALWIADNCESPYMLCYSKRWPSVVGGPNVTKLSLGR